MNLANQMDRSQFNKEEDEKSYFPKVAEVIEPVNPNYAIGCKPTTSNKYYKFMTKINDSGKAFNQFGTNTKGVVCLLSRPPKLNEVIRIESLGKNSVVGKLGRKVGDKFVAT